MFNPNEHLIQLKSRDGSKDYLPVQWRLVWFREQCPQGTIDIEEVEVDLDREVETEVFAWNAEKRRSEKTIKHAKGYARYRATVTDGQGGRAMGTKSENAANFADFIEKAETGAIGRALASLGYGTQFAPDFDEDHRIVDSPVAPPAGTQPSSPQLTVKDVYDVCVASGACTDEENRRSFLMYASSLTGAAVTAKNVMQLRQEQLIAIRDAAKEGYRLEVEQAS